jgi:DNA-binding IclR family transcriptional regulator
MLDERQMLIDFEAKSVKSARRVFEVLEFFTARRPQANAKEVAEALGYPQSSTSELLRSLVNLGYLNCSRRIYRPSVRVALLGSWILPSLFRNGRLFNLMEDIAQEANENVILATQIGLVVRYIHIVQTQNPQAAPVPKTSDRPMLLTSMGRLLLSTLPNDELARTVELLNAQTEPEKRVLLPTLMPIIEQIRRNGYCLSVDKYQPGAGAISVLLPIEPDEYDGQLAIGIAGYAPMLYANERRFIDIILHAIDRHIPRRLHRIRR